MTGFLLALLHGRVGEAYNIGAAGPEISVVQLAEILEAVHGKPLARTFTDYPDTYPADEPQRALPGPREGTTRTGLQTRGHYRAGPGTLPAVGDGGLRSGSLIGAYCNDWRWPVGGPLCRDYSAITPTGTSCGRQHSAAQTRIWRTRTGFPPYTLWNAQWQMASS